MRKRFADIVRSARPARRVVVLLVSVGVLLAVPSILRAKQEVACEECKPGIALPGEKCRVNPLPGWREPERWAWACICEGKDADFNERLGEILDPNNPKHDQKWSDSRTLRSTFLRTILLDEPYRSAIPHRGVRIRGAYFKDKIDLSDASIEWSLVLERSLFKSSVDMRRLATPKFLSLEGSHFKSMLEMDSAKIGGDLSMVGKAKFMDVNLRGAKIGGQLIISDSTFMGTLDMSSAMIGSNLYMVGKTKFVDVNLNGAKIGGLLNMSGSTFMGTLNMSSASIGSNLLMQKAQPNNVDLKGAKIGGQLNMSGSTFMGTLDMNSATIGSDLSMVGEAKFVDVNLKGAKIGGLLNMSGSTFMGTLDISSTTIGNDLSMLRTEFEAQSDNVDLSGAKIGGQFNIFASTFMGTLDMSSTTIGNDLSMLRTEFEAQSDNVDLSGAKIGGLLNMSGSTFMGTLNMSSAMIGGDLSMVGEAKFMDVILAGAKIGGLLSMSDSTFMGTLDMNSATFGSNLLIQKTNFYKPAKLKFLRVNSNLAVRSATLRELDLTGTQIKGHLQFGCVDKSECDPGEHNIKWKGYLDEYEDAQNPKLTLRNTSVGTFEYIEKTWSNERGQLELDGFTYDRIDAYFTNEKCEAKEKYLFFSRESERFVYWLEKDKTYSPHPYRQLAVVLRASGYEDIADDILYASRKNEHQDIKTSWGKWLFLWALWLTIGYGYGWRYFLALAWIAGLVVIGTLVLRISGDHGRFRIISGFLNSACYSLDMLLPVIRLRERHYTRVDLKTSARYWFYFQKIMGYVLIFFVLAGLSGLLE